VFSGHTASVVALALSPNGKLAASGGLDRTVRLWDVSHGTLLHTFAGLPTYPRDVAFTPDGQRVRAACGSTVHEWEVESRQPTPTDLAGRRGSFLTPDGRASLTLERADGDVVYRIWDLAEGKQRGQPVPAADPTALGVSFSADSTQALVIGRRGIIQVIDVARARASTRLKPPEGADFKPTAVAWSATVNQAVAAFSDGSVRLLDLAAARQVRVFRGKHAGAVTAVAVSADGSRALTGGRDKVLWLWEVATGRPLGRFEGHTATVRRVLFVPGPLGRLGLSAGADGSVRRWDLSRPTSTGPAEASRAILDHE
jgi:WD40 repeat protein